MYKFITYDDWLANHKELNPNARHNQGKTEVVLSCNDGTGELTRKQAQDYIANNWIIEVVE